MEEKLTRPVPYKGRLNLKNDYVFKRIFAKPENNAELKELTEAILNEKIKTIVVTNPEISKNYKDEKLGVLDIRAYMNDDTIVDIEMQVSNINTMIDRNITYSSRVIGEQLRIGDNYKILKRFISINLLRIALIFKAIKMLKLFFRVEVLLSYLIHFLKSGIYTNVY